MLFYLVMGGLFSLYTLDLLILIIVSTLARGQEVAALMKKRLRVRKHGKTRSKRGNEKGVDQKESVESKGEGVPAPCKEVAVDSDTEDPEQQPLSPPGPPSPPPPAPPPGPAMDTRDGGCKQAIDGGNPDGHHHGKEVEQEEQLKEGAAGNVTGNVTVWQIEENGSDASPASLQPATCSPSGRSSNFSSDILMDKDQKMTEGQQELPALKMGGILRNQGSAEDLEGANMAASHQHPCSSISQISGIEESGSSTEFWEAHIGGNVVQPSASAPQHPNKFPLVLVQLPMFNEEAHAHLIIDRVCTVSWPRDRLLIQVLDDSTKAHIREVVDTSAAKCMEAGHPVQVLRRTNRQGYKAGAMVEGLNNAIPYGFKYVAIFDADFEPPQDFLEETIGPLEEDPKIGFVQTRWLCPADSFLTWSQKINLGFHFDVEQRARSYLGWFFNFNGTAGVWRIETIQTSGGWMSDTVVEDMDLSLRAYLNGWTAKYLPHVASSNEVPGSLSAYRTQQFRWLSGPMQIIIKAFFTIWHARDIGFTKRLNCYWFFARYILFALITLAVLLVPPVVMWLDPWEWRWPQIFFIASVNAALAVYLYITPFSFAYLIFSIAIGYFKMYAMLSGLCGSRQSKTWKVTQKTGAMAAEDVHKARGLRGCMSRFWLRLRSIQPPYALEMGLMAYYGFMAGMAFWASNWFMGGYCAIMATIFLVLSWGDEFF